MFYRGLNLIPAIRRSNTWINTLNESVHLREDPVFQGTCRDRTEGAREKDLHQSQYDQQLGNRPFKARHQPDPCDLRSAAGQPVCAFRHRRSGGRKIPPVQASAAGRTASSLSTATACSPGSAAVTWFLRSAEKTTVVQAKIPFFGRFMLGGSCWEVHDGNISADGPVP